jgi:SPP1 family holin
MIPKVDLGTKVRTVALFISILNQLLAVWGISPLPFNEEAIELTASTVILGASAIWAWWKDNSFTAKARRAKMFQK